jgi:AraC-like DNA-binding protein/tetratricopeptide (TPR) repeat protein
MQKIKTLFIFGCLLFCNLCISQDFKSIPDSLKKYSYVELMDKILANSQNHEDSYKKSDLYAQTYLLKAKKENNTEQIIYGYKTKSEVVNNLQKKLKYSDSAISIATSKMPNKLSYLYYRRGCLYYNEKRLKEALDYFLKASKDSINISKNLKNRIHYTIGSIKNTQGNYKEALKIYEECEVNARINNSPEYLVYLFGLAELYNRTGKIELSEKYTNKGIASRKTDESGDYYYPYFISNRGKNYYKKKQYNKAVIDLTNTLQTIKNNNDYSNYAENSYYVGECYREQHQDEKAIFYYKKVDSIFTAQKDIYPLTVPSYEHLIAYYKKKQDYQKIVYYSDQFIKADRVLDDNYKYITSKIAKTYDIQKVVASKQAVIASLTSDKKMSLIAIILLLLSIALLGYWFYSYNKQKKKELQKQKELFDAYIATREQKIEPKTMLTNLYEKPVSNKPIQNIIFPEEVGSIKEIESDILEKDTLSSIDSRVVAQISDFLEVFKKEQWFLNTYTVEELSKKMNTNSTYLSRVIKTTKGCSYPQYVNSLRMEYIIEKLVTEKDFLKYSVEALSESSGYNSVDTFVRAFLLHTQMKPSEFVKQLISLEETIQPILKKLIIFENDKGFLDPNLNQIDLAKNLGTNGNYLSKTINHYKGKNFTQYINDLRIEYTIKKIKEDKTYRKYSVKGISKDVGYNNVDVFVKAFVSRTGLKPSVYIKELIESEINL